MASGRLPVKIDADELSLVITVRQPSRNTIAYCIICVPSRKYNEGSIKLPSVGWVQTLVHDEAMFVGITVINEDRIIAMLARPAFDAGHHRVIRADFGVLDYADLKL
uniref:Uncharacterized protein n=1 Tax=uncultured Rhodospirillales bacterium HF0200_01O14 TaxID=710787 RepID=E0XTW8_9PROT|nr:hypothetical protein [uncultured Rhodospirillales bacterium HF0200_01O14]